ncbi:MAG: hypothetical protein CMQ40_12740 [Gammaproteobacteria bacterium]|nr:hypothetical protein [Gammaproteobacteria bacterium]|tara:strand:+ start:1475 stop:1894 length:420 start_codon:yes stop_codon:yes gene_type:complete
MSSAAVRTIARSLVTGASWPAGLPYQETVDQYPSGGVPVPGTTTAWCALEFEGDTDDPMGIGGDSMLREEGRITFRLFGEGMSGDSAILTLADSATAAIRAFDWQSIFIRSLTAPQPIMAEDETWTVFDIVAEYQRDHA